MKQIFLAAAAVLFIGNATFAQDYNKEANRPAPQNYNWQGDDLYGHAPAPGNSDNRNRERRYDAPEHNRWDKMQRGWQDAGYVQNHPVYRRILTARVPVRESNRVEKELYRIRQMEARFAYKGRLGMRERTLLDRELMQLDARVARYYQRGYVWR